MDTKDLLLLVQKALVEVRNLILGTDGVVGLYKNGDVTPWSALISGGDSKRLAHFKEALAEVDSALLRTAVLIEDIGNIHIPVGSVTKVSVAGAEFELGCRRMSEYEIENGYGCSRLGCAFVDLSPCPECER